MAGKDQSGAISRHFGPVTSLISVRPMYEVLTPDGKLVWWATLMRGDPILRFGATFTATKDVTISPRYIVPWNAFLDGKTGRVVAELANALLSLPDRERGPVLSYIWQRKAAIRNLMSRDGGTITFPDVKLVAGESYDYPLVALAQVDADVPYGDMTAVKQWGGKLARLALALPRCDAYFKDLGRQANGTWRVAIYRGYDYLPNDFGFTDGGQFLPLPWCFGTHVTPEFRAGFGTMHLAYGNKPYVITHTSRVTVDLPMPEISDAKLAPDYAHLAGDWLAKGAVMIDDLATTQRTDWTWPQCARMDQVQSCQDDTRIDGGIQRLRGTA